MMITPVKWKKQRCLKKLNSTVVLFFGVLIAIGLPLKILPQVKIGNPFIRNYLPKEYKAISQNFAAVQDERQATAEIRNKGFKNISIIAMTAETMKGDVEECMAAGMNDYIPKPIKRDLVFKLVRKWCLDK